MKQKLIALISFACLIFSSIFLSGCVGNNETQTSSTESKKPKIVTTTTILEDLVSVLGGDKVEVQGLMGPGVDPHLYKASAGDVTLMQNADMVVYNGLHLEGKMGEIFENLSSSKKIIVCAENGLNKEKLIESSDSQGVYDPHIWFDVVIWKDVAKEVTKGLEKLIPEQKEEFQENLKKYLVELDNLDNYIKKQVELLPKESRVLITAHDAFNYFGKAYGIEVKGLQGISTASEAGTADVRELSDFIVKRKIKAIFIESSVPKKNVEALQEAVKAKGFDVKIGGSLYSDSLGDKESSEASYIGTVKKNINVIVNALK